MERAQLANLFGDFWRVYWYIRCVPPLPPQKNNSMFSVFEHGCLHEAFHLGKPTNQLGLFVEKLPLPHLTRHPRVLWRVLHDDALGFAKSKPGMQRSCPFAFLWSKMWYSMWIANIFVYVCELFCSDHHPFSYLIPNIRGFHKARMVLQRSADLPPFSFCRVKLLFSSPSQRFPRNLLIFQPGSTVAPYCGIWVIFLAASMAFTTTSWHGLMEGFQHFWMLCLLVTFRFNGR